MLTAIDTFILERIFTRFAWWFEYKTGRTNFFLAWWAVAISIMMLFFMADLEFVTLHNASLFSFVFYGAFLWQSIQNLRRHSRDEDRAQSATKMMQPSAASFSPHLGYLRLIWLAMCGGNVGMFLVVYEKNGLIPEAEYQAVQALWSAAILASWYLTVVRRPPPRPRRQEVPEGQLAPIRT